MLLYFALIIGGKYYKFSTELTAKVLFPSLRILQIALSPTTNVKLIY